MELGPSHRLGETFVCVVCDETLDGAAQLDGDGAPKPGDVTLCVYCGAPMRFLVDRLELIPDDEAAQLERDEPGFAKARQVIALARKQLEER